MATKQEEEIARAHTMHAAIKMARKLISDGMPRDAAIKKTVKFFSLGEEGAKELQASSLVV